MTELTYHGNGERIDTWLVSQFPYSRSFFHRIIERGGVKVKSRKSNVESQNIHEKIIKKSYQLKEGEMVLIDDVTRYLSSGILDEAPDIDIPIVLEKQDYLVINKPKGVLSHPKSVWDVEKPSVAGFLYHRYRNLPSIGNFIRAGILHRLDKETDGLMLIAKTEKGLAHFKKLFQEKSESLTIQEKESGNLKKFYRATCHITSKGQTFLEDIKHLLPHYIQEPVIAKLPHSVPKIGITKILNFAIKDKKVILELEILTGRTHQIRYHLAHHGLPIVGDYLYGEEDTLPMGLTAWKLVFEDVEGGVIEVKI